MRQHARWPQLRGFDYAAPRSYFVTLCVLKRQRIFANTHIAAIARDQVLAFRHAGWYWLHAYAIMPDHVHLLARFVNNGRTLGRIVGMLKSAILYRARSLGASFAWQDGYYDHILRESESGEEVVEYILRNPERAGLVRQGEPYEFCGVVDRYR